MSRAGVGARLAVAALALLTPGGAAWAAAPPKAAASTPFLPGASSKEPIQIDADKLDYFDKEQKAIYTGNVVVIQGDTKLTCSQMTIFMTRVEAAGEAAPAKAPDAGDPAPGQGASQVRHMDAVGPVTVVSKTQVATGDTGSYDKPANKVWLIGHVTLSDGGNVTKGEKLTYDLTTGQATVDNGKTSGRVHGQFLPGSGDAGADAGDKSKAKKKLAPDNGAAPQ